MTIKPSHKLADEIYDVIGAFADKCATSVDECREDIIVALIYNLMSEVDCRDEFRDVVKHMGMIYDGKMEEKKRAMH